jgi:hypothetical protein
MRSQPVTPLSPTSIANRLRRVFDEEAVDAAARTTGFMRRKRDITPLAPIAACLSSLSTGGTRWLADIQRTLNASLGTAVQYKPFHNQLSKEAFPEFVRELIAQALGQLVLPVLEAIPSDSLARFDDIVIQDGSSMALKDCLADVWPGRFNKAPVADSVKDHALLNLGHVVPNGSRVSRCTSTSGSLTLTLVDVDLDLVPVSVCSLTATATWTWSLAR